MRQPSVQRNGGSLGRRLRREFLAVRVVTVTMRIALREVERQPPSKDRSIWARQLAAWVDGVLSYHRGRIAQLREETTAVPGSAGDDAPELIVTLWGQLDTALAEADAVAREAKERARS